MKKRLWLLCVVCLLSACTTTQDPQTYHQEITYYLTQVDTSYETYSDLTNNNNINNIITITDQLNKTIEEISTIHDTLTTVWPYENDDTTYINTATQYTTQTLSLLRNEETQLLALRAEVANYPDEERTPTIEKEYKKKQQTLIDSINTQIQYDNQMIVDAQKKFAQQHNLYLSGSNTP